MCVWCKQIKSKQTCNGAASTSSGSSPASVDSPASRRSCSFCCCACCCCCCACCACCCRCCCTFSSFCKSSVSARATNDNDAQDNDDTTKRNHNQAQATQNAHTHTQRTARNLLRGKVSQRRLRNFIANHGRIAKNHLRAANRCVNRHNQAQHCARRTHNRPPTQSINKKKTPRRVSVMIKSSCVVVKNHIQSSAVRANKQRTHAPKR